MDVYYGDVREKRKDIRFLYAKKRKLNDNNNTQYSFPETSRCKNIRIQVAPKSK